jgi:hypothetical protein
MSMRANRLLLAAIEEVLGPGTDAARYLEKAIASNDTLDLLLAQASFDELTPEERREIADAVDRLVGQELVNARNRQPV